MEYFHTVGLLRLQQPRLAPSESLCTELAKQDATYLEDNMKQRSVADRSGQSGASCSVFSEQVLASDVVKYIRNQPRNSFSSSAKRQDFPSRYFVSNSCLSSTQSRQFCRPPLAPPSKIKTCCARRSRRDGVSIKKKTSRHFGVWCVTASSARLFPSTCFSLYSSPETLQERLKT